MLAEERQRVILRVLEEKRAATVAVLCQETGASEATIRRDLNELNRQGKLNKVHGGAVLPVSEFESQEPDVLTKSTLHTEQKDRIRGFVYAAPGCHDLHNSPSCRLAFDGGIDYNGYWCIIYTSF